MKNSIILPASAPSHLDVWYDDIMQQAAYLRQRDANATYSTATHSLTCANTLEQLKYVLDKGADPNLISSAALMGVHGQWYRRGGVQALRLAMHAGRHIHRLHVKAYHCGLNPEKTGASLGQKTQNGMVAQETTFSDVGYALAHGPAAVVKALCASHSSETIVAEQVVGGDCVVQWTAVAWALWNRRPMEAFVLAQNKCMLHIPPQCTSSQRAQCIQQFVNGILGSCLTQPNPAVLPLKKVWDMVHTVAPEECMRLFQFWCANLEQAAETPTPKNLFAILADAHIPHPTTNKDIPAWAKNALRVVRQVVLEEHTPVARAKHPKTERQNPSLSPREQQQQQSLAHRLKMLRQQCGKDLAEDPLAWVYGAVSYDYDDVLRYIHAENLVVDVNIVPKTPCMRHASPPIQTALHLASLRGSVNIMRVLLKMGANPDATDVSGNTPLHHYAQWLASPHCTQISKNHMDMLRVLQKRMSDPNLPNKLHHTALMYVLIANGQRAKLNVLEAMVRNGCDPTIASIVPNQLKHSTIPTSTTPAAWAVQNWGADVSISKLLSGLQRAWEKETLHMHVAEETQDTDTSLVNTRTRKM